MYKMYDLQANLGVANIYDLVKNKSLEFMTLKKLQ